MSYGLKTFDSLGVETLNTNYEISRVHSTISGVYVAPNSSLTISVSGMVNDGTWQVFVGNTTSNCYITINVGSFTITNFVSPFGSAAFSGSVLVLRTNGAPTFSGYGFYTTNDANGVQIDQDYSNYIYVGGANNIAVGTYQTLPTGYDFNNCVVLARPSGTNSIARFTINSSNTFTFLKPSGNSYDWVCFAPASTKVLPASGYGMRVYNSSGEVVFDTNYRYLRYAGKLTVPISNFGFTFTSSPQYSEKTYMLVSNLGVMRRIYNGSFNIYTSVGISSTDGVNITGYVHTDEVLTPVIPSQATFGTDRQFTFFHSKSA